MGGGVTQQTPGFANVGLAAAHVASAKVAVSGLHVCADAAIGKVALMAGSKVVKADDALAQFEQSSEQNMTDESGQPEIELSFRVGCETGLDLAVCGRDGQSESREAGLIWSRKKPWSRWLRLSLPAVYGCAQSALLIFQCVSSWLGGAIWRAGVWPWMSVQWSFWLVHGS